MAEDSSTVKVQTDNKWGYRIIDRAKYDASPDQYSLYEDEEVQPADEEVAKVAKEDAARRKVNANRGIQRDGMDASRVGRNTSGTYSEPTPTDIRYPDKSKTEFENNAGAFLGRSAAGLRKEYGVEDAPGGLDPESHRKKMKAERARRRREAQEAREARAAQAEATMGSRLADMANRTEVNEDVDIPEDWRDLPWRDQVKLAQELTGDDSKLTKSEAQEIIESEESRRSNPEAEEEATEE